MLPLLGIYPNKIKTGSGRGIFIFMFIVILLTRVKEVGSHETDLGK